MSKAHKGQHPILEVVHRSEGAVSQVDRGLSQVDLGNTAIRAIAGSRAFRDYNWLTGVARTSAAGDLRGMVVSAKWRVAFRYSSEVGEYMENIGLLAGFAAGIAEAESELERLANSNEPAALKGARIAAIAGTAAQRALLGAIPAGTHLIYKSLQGWCMMAGLPGGRFQSAANQCIATLRQADALVQSSFKAVTDTSNQSKALWLVIDTVLASRPGR
jgi:hypothetical protein